MNELWKAIEGYPDYLISNYGNVKSLKTQKIRNPSITNNGYLITSFRKNTVKAFSIHRLVAKAFIPNPHNKPDINHIDGNKQNNRVDNLEWCTCSDNHKHAYKLGLKNKQGMNHHLSKLTDNEVLTIHGLYLSGMTQKEIAKIYEIDQTNVSYIISGKTWNHLINGVN